MLDVHKAIERTCQKEQHKHKNVDTELINDIATEIYNEFSSAIGEQFINNLLGKAK